MFVWPRKGGCPVRPFGASALFLACGGGASTTSSPMRCIASVAADASELPRSASHTAQRVASGALYSVQAAQTHSLSMPSTLLTAVCDCHRSWPLSGSCGRSESRWAGDV
eukprot:5725013-Prymnesium_polylepis.2